MNREESEIRLHKGKKRTLEFGPESIRSPVTPPQMDGPRQKPPDYDNDRSPRRTTEQLIRRLRPYKIHILLVQCAPLRTENSRNLNTV